MGVAASTAGEGAERNLAALVQQHVRPSRDAHARMRRAVAILAALLLHASILALLLLKPEQQELPPPLTVELVAAPPPTAAAEPPAPRLAPSPPAPAAARDQVRASGGELERDVGEPPKLPAPQAMAPRPEPHQAKAEAAAPAPAAAASASKLPAPELEPSNAALPLPLPPQAKPEPRPEPASAREAAVPQQAPANAKSESASLGKGGGDPYLNKLRAEIERHRTYPPAARALGLEGTAQYVMLIDRQGRLMRVTLLHSSGADILDKTGIEMIERSAPFAPLPPEFVGEQLKLVLTLHLAP